MAAILNPAPHLHHLSVVAKASAGVTALDIVTLVIAAVGALTGVVALVWQAVSFSLSGGRVNTTLQRAWLGTGGAVVGDPATWNPGKAPLPGYDDEYYGVLVQNVGRLPVTVTRWSIDIGPTSLGAVTAPWNKTLPHRLDVGEEATWFASRIQVDAIAQVVSEGAIEGKPIGPRVPLRGSASLGSGRTKASKPFYVDAGK